jgi:hypothetical protein
MEGLMTQFQTQSPILPASQNDGITSGREIGAFIAAELIKTIGAYMVALSGALSPLYLWALHIGSRPLVWAVSAGISAFWGAVVFVLFMLFRGLFGGVPTIVNRDQDATVTTRGGEIGAFVLAYGIVLTVILVLNGLFLAQAYAALGRALAPLLGLGTSIVGAVIVYILFVALRRGLLSR